ncbi:uncharacterized protein PRCAT00000170001 [Priceomyces carsonii]|uniref:uncharacterized protein n=1 Tax=Priceomyces carsonii TaxID=28549 RepID=UPI002EDB82F7|nr:unnamed protein product [Priceomyces carsonii]
MSHNPDASIQEQQKDTYFGKEVVNRVSFLREDHEFISNSVFHPSTRFIFFQDGNPLINKDAEEKLIILTNGDNQLPGKSGFIVKKGLQSSSPKWSKILETWSKDNKELDDGTRDGTKPTFLFMGLQDESVGLNLKNLKFSEDGEVSGERYLDHQGRYQGIPYYAVDVTRSPELAELILHHIMAYSNIKREGLFFSHSRKHYLGFTTNEAALYSHGKMFLDWLERNKFCPGCGWKVIPIHAGGKLRCTNDRKDTQNIYECPVKNTRVSNVSFPRTDAVVITAITNASRDKILLSLSKRYAVTKMYACTAGFMEPSETVENATKREIWEETGVKCDKIKIVMSQPWPFPGNLMIGCVAEVDFNGSNEIIHLGHDRELADARWFDVSFVRTLMDKPRNDSESNPEGILLPSSESVAFLLIKLVVDEAVPNPARL